MNINALLRADTFLFTIEKKRAGRNTFDGYPETN